MPESVVNIFYASMFFTIYKTPPKPIITRRFTFTAINDSTNFNIFIIQTNTPEAVLIRGLCDNIYPQRCTLHDLEPDNQHGVVLSTWIFPKLVKLSVRASPPAALPNVNVQGNTQISRNLLGGSLPEWHRDLRSHF